MGEYFEIKISRHAKKRMKERCGLNKKASERLAYIAYTKGLTHSELCGRLKRYVDYLYFREEKANAIRIYGNEVYIFQGNVLITVFDLPNRYLKSAQQLSRRKQDCSIQETEGGG